MKAILTVCLLLVGPVVAFAQSDTAIVDIRPDDCQALRPLLVAYSLDVELGSEVRAVQSALPSIEQYLKVNLPRGKGLTIDVILQLHDYEASADAVRALIPPLQTKVRQYLEAGAYAVIGWEGSTVRQVTFPALIDDCIAQSRRRNVPVDSLALGAAIHDQLPYDGALQYLEAHPSAIVIGTDEQALMTLHDKILQRWENRPLDRQVDEIRERLCQLRSAYITARIVEELRTRRQTRGVDIIGCGHEPSVSAVMETYGIKGRFFDACR